MSKEEVTKKWTAFLDKVKINEELKKEFLKNPIEVMRREGFEVKKPGIEYTKGAEALTRGPCTHVCAKVCPEVCRFGVGVTSPGYEIGCANIGLPL